MDSEFDVRFSQEQAEIWAHLTTAHISTLFLTIWDELWPTAQNWYNFLGHTLLCLIFAIDNQFTMNFASANS